MDMDMEEHDRMRRSVASFYKMWGTQTTVRRVTSDEKDCSVAGGEDKKEEAEEKAGWVSSDVQVPLCHPQQNALPLHDGSSGPGCSQQE